MHKDIHHTVTQSNDIWDYCYSFAVWRYREKTEMVTAKVGSNLKILSFIITFRVSQFQVKGDMLNIMDII